MSFAVAAWSKAWGCVRWLAGIAVSILDEDVDVCILRVSCVVR